MAAASILDVKVNLLMVKLLTMNQYGYEFDLPFFPKAEFIGTIGGSTDLILKAKITENTYGHLYPTV